MRLDILLGSVAVLMAILGNMISVWPPKATKFKIAYMIAFALLGASSIVLIVKQSNETRRQQERTAQEQRELRAAILRMTGVQVHLLPISAPNPGAFTIGHNLGCTPREADIQMTSLGFIGWQSPTKKYDSTNLYLMASDGGLTADVLVSCQP